MTSSAQMPTAGTSMREPSEGGRVVSSLERLEFVETKRPLVFDDVDYTINDPAYLAAAIGSPLEYAQRIEALVGHTAMGDLMPRRDAQIGRFLATWTVDELGHARALGELMRLLGLEPLDLSTFTPPSHNRWLPTLGRASQSLHDVITTIWASPPSRARSPRCAPTTSASA